MFGYLATACVEALGAALGAGVPELTLGVDDLTLAADRFEELLGDGRAHVDVVRLEEGQVPVVGELASGSWISRVSMTINGMPSGDDRVGAVDQRVDGCRVEGDEVPVLAGDRLQRAELVLGVELAVERLDLDAEQTAEERAVSMPWETQVDAAPTSTVAARHVLAGRSSGSRFRLASASARVVPG